MSTTEPSLTNSRLAAAVADDLCRYYDHLADRVERAVRSLPREKLWVKPYPYGNSIGHLVLHLTGNLNHYVGSLIAGTGYVRDRPKEFTDPVGPPAEQVLGRFREAISLVTRTIRGLGDDGLMAPIDALPPARTRFGVLLLCASHLNNHIGQMGYLVQAQGHSMDGPAAW